MRSRPVFGRCASTQDARADELVRPIRARKGLNFYESWTEATTAEWLCRFEKRLF